MNYDKIDREKRERADRHFEQHQKDAEGYGQEAELARNKGKIWTANEMDRKAKEAQREMTDALNYKLRDNQAKGRTYQDGHEN